MPNTRSPVMRAAMPPTAPEVRAKRRISPKMLPSRGLSGIKDQSKSGKEELLFLQKKKQKNSYLSRRLRGQSLATEKPGETKVFWFFFSKKNVLLASLFTLPVRQ
jgi:hypothetical protein